MSRKASQKFDDDAGPRWPNCMACGQPKIEHTDEEIAAGCKRKVE